MIVLYNGHPCIVLEKINPVIHKVILGNEKMTLFVGDKKSYKNSDIWDCFDKHFYMKKSFTGTKVIDDFIVWCEKDEFNEPILIMTIQRGGYKHCIFTSKNHSGFI